MTKQSPNNYIFLIDMDDQHVTLELINNEIYKIW